jgi:hypothetical protein
MKTFNLRASALFLALVMQVFAQRFTTGEPDSFSTGSIQYAANSPILSGYAPHNKQIAALGEKNSAYANLMLAGGRDTLLNSIHAEKVGTYNVIESGGTILGIVHPFDKPNIFTAANNDTIHDNNVTGVAVLDSFSDSKKTATVVFASLRKLVIMKISISNANSISFSILSSMNMPESMWEINVVPRWSMSYGSYDISNYHMRRLALLGTSQSGANKTYHLATGNPLSKKGNGRVDFFSITENTWAFLQPNTNGLTAGTNGLVFNDSSYFGKDLAVIDNFDKKGGKALAVLLPASAQFPKSALYVFQMENDWTPSSNLPTVMAGSSKPWLEDPGQSQNCGGLGIADWGDETPHLLVSCSIGSLAANDGDISSIIAMKDIILDPTGNISNYSVFSSKKFSIAKPSTAIFYVYSNPILIKKHKNDLHSISLAVGRAGYGSYSYYMTAFTVMDADYSKNFSITANTKETVANIDSLFYKSGTTGFSAKTLSGLAQCSIQSSNLLCEGSENAIGSWSGIELSSGSNCDPYKACKRKDTIFVYVRSAGEPINTALRVPKSILVPYYGQVNLGDIKPLSYFRNPDLQSTSASWDAGKLKLSTAGSMENGFSIIPFSKNEGIDTLMFKLSISSSYSTAIDNYPVFLHVADTSKILSNGIPESPGSDTVWNTAQKKYIALPYSNSNGNIYTYDIAQNELEPYAEIIGGYLHILRVDVADVTLSYTENGQIKYRKITLMPENKASPPSSIPFAAELPVQNFKAAHINGGLQINGLNGEFELVAYNFKGMEIQREKAYAKGSVFVKLKHKCPQVVQIRFANEKVYIRVANSR